jgi:hypothetical protein
MSTFFMVWLCTQERYNQEVAIILVAAARYCRAEDGSSPDDAHPENSTPGSLVCISLRTGHVNSQVLDMNASSFFVISVGVRFSFGGWPIHIFQWARRGRGEATVPCLDGAGSFGIPWRIPTSMKKNGLVWSRRSKTMLHWLDGNGVFRSQMKVQNHICSSVVLGEGLSAAHISSGFVGLHFGNI